MTTLTAPSVINPDISLPLRSEVLAPSGDCLLSSNNAADASNKYLCTVSADDINVDTTLPSVPTSGPGFNTPSGLPVNKVPVVTQPLTTNTTLNSSIHAHPISASTNPPNNDKNKSVLWPLTYLYASLSLMVMLLRSNPLPPDFMLQHIFVTHLSCSKKNLLLIALYVTK
ncbi:hypothetical protein RhiirA1_403166 [Rhizophagus irregularis]|uniref:Uncharacterized protein n=1 Tax=Rhizophagus irregularis TaxID=588596 RepID=A0A2I1FN83_9GLOM|nr:hypothetical protein RhiirA1_403166 [Rhizophagus irregularis]PKY35823.1 hypothetical protein RhiirB3_396439 [Rhizophagus irregularis]